MVMIGWGGGQSNGVGNGRRGPWRVHPNVYVRNNLYNRNDLNGLGTAWVRPTPTEPCFQIYCNNQFLHVAHYLATLTGEGQRLIIACKNGQSILQWTDGANPGPIYKRTVEILKRTGANKFDWFGWNQGSADILRAAVYPELFGALLAQAEDDGIIDAQTPIFVTETAHAPEINPVLKSIADNDPRIGFVPCVQYPTYDDAHFVGDALARLGYDGVRAMSETETVFKDLVDVSRMSRTTGSTFSRS